MSTAARSASRREHHAQRMGRRLGPIGSASAKIRSRGGSCPTAALGSSHGAPSAVPPNACWTATDSMPHHLRAQAAPPAPDFSSQDAQPLSPPKAQLRISGVFAPFGRQQCHLFSGGVLSPGVRHALARDRANGFKRRLQ